MKLLYTIVLEGINNEISILHLNHCLLHCKSLIIYGVSVCCASVSGILEDYPILIQYIGADV
jgi:hypothetical protein